MPSGAKVSFGDSDIFAAAARVTGPEIPAAFPRKYQTGLRKAKTSGNGTAEDVPKLLAWEKAQGLEMAPAKRAVFEEYAKGQFTFGMLLVEHPTVPDAATYKGSVVLQRGVIVLAKGSETLFLRPYLHSAKDATHAVNLTPQGGVQDDVRIRLGLVPP